MKEPLTGIEKQLKELMPVFPEYYDHILEGEELSAFIMMLINNYSDKIDRHAIYEESEKIISGGFFEKHTKDLVYNQFTPSFAKEYKESFVRQKEDIFINDDFDISCSRQIRYMPAQWHYTYYFQIYYVRQDNCEICFRNGEKIDMAKGDLLILSPFAEHATPCYQDGKIMELFLLRSSTFDKVFWEQLNAATIMAHFFRSALKNENNRSPAYLLFHTKEDEDIGVLIDQIRKELKEKENYSSQMANAMMSLLFCLLLRRYEDSVILPDRNNLKWKAEFAGIFSFIQNNYARTSLEEVASKFNYSPKQIGRIIQRCFNMSYTELITFLKMDNAVRMLKEKTGTMEEIASALGYSDLSSFYRAFKKYYRDTPANYMKNE